MADQVTTDGAKSVQEQTPGWAEIAMLAANLVFKVILPAIAEFMVSVKKSNITVEDIRAMVDYVKRPEEYFEQDDGQTH